MTRDGRTTRTRILDTAESLVMEHGFAATTVDRVIEKAGITKGSFFYHFKSKADLAHALVERYAERDAEHLRVNLQRAERLVSDPLQQMLLFVGLFEEEAARMVDPSTGCLFASFCYETQLFDESVHAAIRQSFGRWREVLAAKLRDVCQHHPPQAEVSPESLADLLNVVFEGAFVLGRSMRDPAILPQQLRQYRQYLELLFSPRSEPQPPRYPRPDMAI